jgi:hypothetical protein
MVGFKFHRVVFKSHRVGLKLHIGVFISHVVILKFYIVIHLFLTVEWIECLPLNVKILMGGWACCKRWISGALTFHEDICPKTFFACHGSIFVTLWNLKQIAPMG